MGTSVHMIERHYGTVLDGATVGIASRLASFEAEQDRARDRGTDEPPDTLGHKWAIVGEPARLTAGTQGLRLQAVRRAPRQDSNLRPAA
jgi:hypothetical protein